MDRIKSNWIEFQDIEKILAKISIDHKRLSENLSQTKINTIPYRIHLLKQLSLNIIKNRVAIEQAQQNDLYKNPIHISVNEIFAILKEIQNTTANLPKWAKDEPIYRPKKSAPVLRKEARGLCLIISPWNYPLQIPLLHLISCVAAGNAVILKLSEFTPQTNHIISAVLKATFPDTMISIVEGDNFITEKLLEYTFDHIHYTGSSRLAKKVLEAAAKHFSSTTIDLVGKSPVFIDETVDIANAADQIIQGKFLNAGQNCIAPDFVLVSKKIKSEFVELLLERLKYYLINNNFLQPEYNKILNFKHFDRLHDMYQEAIKLNAIDVTNGTFDRRILYISPCILTNIPINSKIVEDEIFGPILPLIQYNDLDDAIQMVNSKNKALAMYIFSNNEAYIQKIINLTQSKTVCINTCNIEYMQPNIPYSGLNVLNLETTFGKFDYDEFSYKKVIYKAKESKKCWFSFFK